MKTITTRPVVVTGIGLTSPIGNSFDEALQNVYDNKSSIERIEAWTESGGLKSLLGSPVKNFDEMKLPRNIRRSMSRVSLLAIDATQKAIEDSGLTEDLIQSDRTGVSFGSTMGGTSAIDHGFREYLKNNSFQGILSSMFLKIMSHTCAANIITTFKIPGRVMASCTACTSASQAIGFGYEMIKFGLADRVVCGGAEELHVFVSGAFDILGATSSKYNDSPKLTPRPFSADRDGIVVGEGAGTLILEARDFAEARKAKIYAEVAGFATNADGNHFTNPSVTGMQKVMEGALKDAEIEPRQVAYINAHGTGTHVGDRAESIAVCNLFRDQVPVSSLKGHFGHLMGACGSIESIVCLGFLEKKKAAPTLHLDRVDPECAPIDYIKHEPRKIEGDYILKNNFAFGGINTSLVFKRAGNRK